MRYRTNSDLACPLVIRAPCGGGIHGALYHSQSIEAFYAHVPGLKVVLPSTPADAAGLLRAAIRDPDPVLFLEHKNAVTGRSRARCPPATTSSRSAPPTSTRRGHGSVTCISYGYELHRASRRPTGSPRMKGSRPRSSTCAPSRRSTWTRSSRPSARPRGRWWCTRTIGRTARAPRSPRRSPRRRCSTWTRPSCGSADRTSPRCRIAAALEHFYMEPDARPPLPRDAGPRALLSHRDPPWRSVSRPTPSDTNNQSGGTSEHPWASEPLGPP